MQQPFGRFSPLKSIPRPAVLGVSLIAVVALAAGCGQGEEPTGGKVDGNALVIYTSLPLSGPIAADAESVLKAEQLALSQADGKAGKFSVSLTSLDSVGPDSTSGSPDPKQISINARKAARNDKTIAYIGELTPAASAYSIPILNEAGILQVSPGDPFTALTKSDGVVKGAPDVYYPNDKRNFARVVPADSAQGSAIVTDVIDDKSKSVVVVTDGSQYGEELSNTFTKAAKQQDLEVLKSVDVDVSKPDQPASAYKTVTEAVSSEKPDNVVYLGEFSPGTSALFRAVAQADPKVKINGPDALASEAFVRQLGSAADQAYFTHPALGGSDLPVDGKKFEQAYEKEYGSKPVPFAAFGYESMSAVLASIEAAGDKGGERQAVIDQFFKIKDRDSAVGTYSIDSNGDTNLTTYGSWNSINGQLTYERKLSTKSN